MSDASAVHADFRSMKRFCVNIHRISHNTKTDVTIKLRKMRTAVFCDTRMKVNECCNDTVRYSEMHFENSVKYIAK